MLIATCKIKLIMSAFYFHKDSLKMAERKKDFDLSGTLLKIKRF